LAEKRAACDRIDVLCHTHNEAIFPALSAMFKRCGVNPEELLDQQALSWEQARALAHHPLCTVGAHTVTHSRLSRLSDSEVRTELEDSRAELERRLGIAVDHLAYPFGGIDACGRREIEAAKAAGFRTAVTTRTGNLFAEHRRHLHCLPRRSVSSGMRRIRNSLYGVESILRGVPKFATEQYGSI
jgi:peptidoglycan/xylan/chitin deacetylase (PgdA/CDA1 family)